MSASWSPPVAHSATATLAQQVQSQVQAQVQPQATSQTLAQTPAQRSLPQPSTSANATILSFAGHSVDNQSPESNRLFPTLSIRAAVAPSSNPPFPNRGRPLPTPTGTTDKQATMDLGRFRHGVSSSFVKSAFLTQSSVSPQPQPQLITTKPTPSRSKKLLSAPSPHPVKKSEFVGLSRTSGFAIQNSSSSASSPSAMPKRRITPPRFQSQPSSESSGPTKENAPASILPWNKFSGLPAAVSTISKSTSTTSSSISATYATTSNSTSDTSVPPPKKSYSIWKHTIPDYPAPAWGYAVGMVSEPHPKPKAQSARAGAPPAEDMIHVKGKLKKEQNEIVALPPPPVPAVSSTKGTSQHQQYPPSQYRQLGQPVSTSFIQSGVQQRHTYQHLQAYCWHARSPATHSETQDEDEEDDEEEDSKEETRSDEEDEEPDSRYNAQNKRQKYTRPMTSIAIGANVPGQSLSRRYDQKFEEMICTPKRKLRLKPKVIMNKMDPYTAYVNTNSHKSRIVPRRGRDDPQSQAKDITPKVTNKNILKPKKHILSRRARPSGGLICGGCNGFIFGRIVSLMGSRWHPACFRCRVCNELLEHVNSYEHEGQLYCHLDYHEVRSVLRQGGGE